MGISMDVRRSVFRALGEGLHTLPEAQQRLAEAVEKHGKDEVHEVIDRYFMIVTAHVTGERFLALKIEYSQDDRPRPGRAKPAD
jgi:hypothetical protein